MDLIPKIVQNQDEMARWRHDFHQHPEAPLHEQRTGSRIAELLRSFDCDEVIEKMGMSGVVGVLYNGQGRSIALTAAIDAQTQNEENPSIDYASRAVESMHALGHDGEIAMLLGAAKYLAKTRNFQGTVIFIFYSAYGMENGAQMMIEEGLFDRFSIDEIYGVQNFPGMPIGTIAVAPGACMSAVGELLLKLSGTGGFSAFPNRDHPILALSAIIHSLENLSDSDHPFFCVTSVASGETFHLIPKEAELKATIHYFNSDLEKRLPDSIDRIIKKIAKLYRVKAMVSYRLVCLPTVNAVKPVKFARQAAEKLLGKKQARNRQPKLMFGKGLANFLNVKPGACITEGNGDTAGLMNSNYDFNDAALSVGASLWVKLAEQFS